MYFDDFAVGQVWEIEPFEMTREAIIRFAQDYDPLPLHLDEEYAKTTRFGGLIASGVHSFMATWTAFVRTFNPLGDELVAGMSNHMSWSKPIYPGDTLRGVVEVVGLTRREGRASGVLEVELRGFNQHEEQVLAGGARILMKAQTVNS